MIDFLSRRAIDTLDCPGKFIEPVGAADPSCGRFVLASPAAVSEVDPPAVPYASLIVPAKVKSRWFDLRFTCKSSIGFILIPKYL